MQTERVYGVDDRVRVKTQDGWRAARIVEVDQEDSVLPYQFLFEDDGVYMWIVRPTIVPEKFDIASAYAAMRAGTRVRATHAPSGETKEGRIYKIQVSLDSEIVYVLGDEGVRMWADLNDVEVCGE